MPRNLRDYISIAEHTADGQVDGTVALAAVVNDAGHYLFGLAEWAWRRRRAELDLVDGQAYVALPTDFDQLIAVGSLSRYSYSVHMLPPDRFEKIRGDAIINPVQWHLTLEWPDQADTTTLAGGPRMAVYPTPSGDTNDAIYAVYRSKWTELSAMDSVPNIPADMESLLVQLVRAFAVGEASGQGPAGPLEAVLQSSMLRALITKYGLTEDSEGPMEGGVAQTRIVEPPYLHQSIGTYTFGPQ